MKRNLISVVAAFALLLSLCPLPAFAAAAGDVEYVATVTPKDGQPTDYIELEKAFDEAQKATSATVTLLKDVDYKPPLGTMDAAILLKSGDVTLDGSGNTLTFEWGTGFSVSGGNLTVENVTVKAWETPIKIDGAPASVTIKSGCQYPIYLDGH